MPEYLAPGVYMEEVSFRSKSIEGVPTSTTGFVGMTRYGPVPTTVLGQPRTTEPRLITSFTEFERVYGGLEDLVFTGGTAPCYTAHAARAFFNNGGKRLYISRTFAADAGDGIASLDVTVGGALATWRARWPGRYGNVAISVTPMRTKVSLDSTGAKVKSVSHGTVLEVLPAGGPTLAYFDLPTIGTLRVVHVADDGTQHFYDSTGALAAPQPTDALHILELKVTVVDASRERADFYERLAGHPRQMRYLGRVLEMDNPEDENAVIALQWVAPDDSSAAGLQPSNFAAAGLLLALLGSTPSSAKGEPSWAFLGGGNDGALVTAADIEGNEADPDDPDKKATGIASLGEVEDIAIVAAPDIGAFAELQRFTAAQALVTHAENARYRIAIVDGPPHASLNQIRHYRGQFDSKYAAMYHPWIEILDPLQRPSQGAPPKRILVPPSGFVAGIYARSDIERGVHKAPANEIVRGLTKFEININKPRQDVLNPEGVNALRFFEGRGNRVWGARTMSSDPEWKYVNVRRLFIFIEHSIDKSTQWAVFEPNNRQLWDNIRSTVEDFLLTLWLQGALLGDKPEEAFFVRCDRTTMTQNDLDNGRMICLVGLAPTKPAEFVIFRVGQWTGDAKRS